MSDTLRKEIKLFYCYAHEDKALRDELEIHLSGLKRQYRLTNWYDRQILPGEDWEQAIDKNLTTADLILLLISPHFMDSDYCYGKEMQRALKRHQAGTCRVIPILLRPTYWEEAPFSTIQLLPTGAVPITRWADRDEAFYDVVKGINAAIKALLLAHKTKEEWLEKGYMLSNLKRYEEALAAYEQTSRLDPNYALAYYNKGNTLSDLKRYEEALAAYEQAIRLDFKNADIYINKGTAFHNLKRYREAHIAFEQATRLDPSYTSDFLNKDNALKRYIDKSLSIQPGGSSYSMNDNLDVLDADYIVA